MIKLNLKVTTARKLREALADGAACTDQDMAEIVDALDMLLTEHEAKTKSKTPG